MTASHGGGGTASDVTANSNLPSLSHGSKLLDIAASLHEQHKQRAAPAQLSVEALDVPLRAGEGRPRRNVATSTGNFFTTYDSDVTSLYSSFVKAVDSFGPRNFLGRRVIVNGEAKHYEWTTYQQAFARVSNLASGMLGLNIPVKANVGIYSVNTPEWIIAEKACFAINLVTVPLYDTLGDEAIKHICNQCEIELLFASSVVAPKLLSFADKIAALKTIVIMDRVDEGLVELAKQKSISVIHISELEKTGSAKEFTPRLPQPKDLATICYTSGTSGTPKGVMLPHSALVAETTAVLTASGVNGDNPYAIRLLPDDVHISYLPLAHILERLISFTMTSVGASMGFYQGITDKLIEDIQELKPTIFISVPRLFNRIYDKVMDGIRSKGFIANVLFDRAYSVKKAALRNHGQLTDWFYDRLVFSKIRARLGGRVRCIFSGSAPITPKVLEFLRICFSCDVYEGYGQTETCGGITMTVKNDWSTGNIGIPFSSCEVKLVDVPDMAYTSNDVPFPRGEICVRGPCCFTGYYKDPEKTKETIDSEGWVRTGDIGMWDQHGRIKIVDRRKDIFKLSQGEYVTPEFVECTICSNPYVAQAFVHGESSASSTVAVIVPDEENIKKWALSNNIDTSCSFEELCTHPKVNAFILDEIQHLGRKGSKLLKGFEIPKAIHVEPSCFSVNNDLLTPTFKLKRHEARKRYSTHFSKLYESLSCEHSAIPE